MKAEPLVEPMGINAEPALARMRDITAIANVLLEVAPDAIVIVSSSGTIEYANDQVAALLGYNRLELVGKAVEILVPEALRRGHGLLRQNYMANPMRRPMGVGLDLKAVRKDGSQFPVEISLSPVDTTMGLLVMAIIHDVTESRAAATEKMQLLEREAERAHQLLSIISHELRTPVTIAGGLLENLEDSGLLTGIDNSVVDYLKAIEQAVMGLSQKVDDVVRLAGRQFRQLVAAVSLPDVIAAVHCDLRPLLEVRRVALVERVEDGLPDIQADAGSLYKAVTNLVRNAVNASTQGQGIEVRARAGDGVILCEVVDKGAGIAEEDLNRLFEPLTQLDMSDTRRMGGFGIGLSVVREIIQAHRGHLGVDSTKGQGSRFWFTLPVIPPENMP